MHIKQIIIEGFKSYKEQQALDEFSPHINVVVGANGSGKSNFFHAIRFVLNDIFTSLRPEDRQKLLHEGAGHAVMSAYVEVVFDNSDNRLPVDRDEVRLRRTIGLKKDDYHLDKKHITKTEVMQLLETAGFSRANPYNVVQQGKITAMATMSDQQRLEMLKEIGGTKIYEDRRRESLKTLHETDTRCGRINEMVAELEGKLAELDAEREELVKYQGLDKTRRSLEYAIYDKEVTETRDKIEQVEAEREAEAERGATAAEEAANAKEKLKEVEREVKAVAAVQSQARAKRSAAEKECQEAVRKRAKLELDVGDLEERRGQGAQTQAECKRELKKLTAELAAREKQLAAARDEADKTEAEEASLAAELADSERRLQALYAKQGRSSQFKTPKERDAWVKAEVGRLEKARAAKLAASKELRDEAARSSEELAALAKEIEAKAGQVGGLREEVGKAEARCRELTAERDASMDERKEAWRGADEAEGQIRNLRAQLSNCEHKFERAVARDIQRGLNSARRLCREHNINGVHGILVELFECLPQLYTAVEVSAGNSLFQLVVDSDDVATRIVQLLNQEKAGRVTFIPLNRINPQNVRYPNTFGTDAVPLISHLKYDKAKYDKAMRHVFGKTLVCKNLDVATDAGRTTDLNCVTIEGDQVGKKGTLTGGFLDAARSKMEAQKAMMAAQQELTAAQQTLRGLKDKVADFDKESSRVCKDLAAQEAELKHLKEKLRQAQADLKALEGRRAAGLKANEARERRLKDAAAGIAEVERQLADTHAEAGTDLHAQLSPAERAELAKLVPGVGDLTERKSAAKGAATVAAAQLAEIESDLATNLVRRKEELEAKLAAASADEDSSAVESVRAQLAAAEREVDEATAAQREAEEAAESAAVRVRELKAEQERLKELQDSGEQRAQDEAKSMERLLLRRAQLQQKKADLEKKIRDLGSLPADAFEKYRDSALPALHRSLQKVQGQLKKFGNVNKKALDQYMSFVEQRDDLAKRQAENARADKSIRNLINTLDLRREEAIERTFKGVAKNFREIFKELEPNGKGELVMQLRANSPEGEDDAETAGVAGGSATEHEPGEKYTGVKVRVSFGGRETLSMKQLSGGQKTLVALALIFAIQRCDPAPFYLFDEIDAALDQNYRSSVARMVARQANDPTNPAQFIITTFHPQIVMEADKIYGVSHSNRLSRVDLVTREDALEFVTAEQLRAKTNEQQEDAL